MRSELGGLRYVVSHPCDKKKSQGWGTENFWLVSERKAGPSAALRFAQDDSSQMTVQDGGR
jgi:hypothetical protein